MHIIREESSFAWDCEWEQGLTTKRFKKLRLGSGGKCSKTGFGDGRITL